MIIRTITTKEFSDGSWFIKGKVRGKDVTLTLTKAEASVLMSVLEKLIDKLKK